VGPVSHSNIGILLGSVLGLDCWNNQQYRLQQNLCSFTTYWQQNYTNPESQIIHLFSLYTAQKESACCYCSYLPVISNLCTNQLHCSTRNYPRLTYQQYYPRVFSQWLQFTAKRIWIYFTNLLTAVASCMCIAQGRSNLPVGNTNSFSNVGFQC
jgi:hypothetical protein